MPLYLLALREVKNKTKQVKPDLLIIPANSFAFFFCSSPVKMNKNEERRATIWSSYTSRPYTTEGNDTQIAMMIITITKIFITAPSFLVPHKVKEREIRKSRIALFNLSFFFSRTNTEATSHR